MNTDQLPSSPGSGVTLPLRQLGRIQTPAPQITEEGRPGDHHEGPLILLGFEEVLCLLQSELQGHRHLLLQRRGYAVRSPGRRTPDQIQLTCSSIWAALLSGAAREAKANRSVCLWLATCSPQSPGGASEAALQVSPASLLSRR